MFVSFNPKKGGYVTRSFKLVQSCLFKANVPISILVVVIVNY
ncbi:hypothetical protein PCIT_a0826 [Pseudoalteromonas citrea]|uniref:Uncharacterized protein n=1 Tax=Pseudoalteromonas citrea TaxID=43655 RepID=A0AAD4ALG6_9GAMM|nr:hypothetical protein PCIT_a0826 [Pseudoalteromonas citrea]